MFIPSLTFTISPVKNSITVIKKAIKVICAKKLSPFRLASLVMCIASMEIPPRSPMVICVKPLADISIKPYIKAPITKTVKFFNNV